MCGESCKCISFVKWLEKSHQWPPELKNTLNLSGKTSLTVSSGVIHIPSLIPLCTLLSWSLALSRWRRVLFHPSLCSNAALGWKGKVHRPLLSSSTSTQKSFRPLDYYCGSENFLWQLLGTQVAQLSTLTSVWVVSCDWNGPCFSLVLSWLLIQSQSGVSTLGWLLAVTLSGVKGPCHASI